LKNSRWFLVAALVIVLDQLSKYFVLHHLTYGQPVAILPMLNFTLVHNTGIAFSLFDSIARWQRWILSALTLIVSIILVVWIMQSESNKKGFLLALSLILGGALSNLIDRLHWGYVVDFIDFYLGSWHFATFNVADSAITVGAILLGILVIFKRA